MEAIVIAGGFGTRLRQIVADVPKPMAPVAGRPFLEIVLSSLAKKEFSHIVISVGYQSEKIIEYFGNSFNGIQIEYVIENTPLGTGGAVLLAMSKVKGDHVYIFNGDTFLEVDIIKLEKFWTEIQSNIIVGKKVDDKSRYGGLLLSGSRIVDFSEKGSGGVGIINAGCYVLNTAAFNKTEVPQPFSLESKYFYSEAKAGRLHTFLTDGIFIDIGIPEDYFAAQDLFAEHKDILGEQKRD